MKAVHDIRYRLLRERLKQMVSATEQIHDEDGVRLARCCLALLDWHQVDKKGRCQYCRRQPWSRRCTVVPMVGYYLEQPS
ncbi:MAG: hypothetical protein LC775_04525 [Acidobacteria bacterium]|nr:hypothetical protein [Acidobacteriota bacterium]